MANGYEGMEDGAALQHYRTPNAANRFPREPHRALTPAEDRSSILPHPPSPTFRPSNELAAFDSKLVTSAPRPMRGRDPLAVARPEAYGNGRALPERRPTALTRRPRSTSREDYRPTPANRYNRPGPTGFREPEQEIIEPRVDAYDVPPTAWAPAASIAAPVDPRSIPDTDAAELTYPADPTYPAEPTYRSAEPTHPVPEPLPTISDRPSHRTGGFHRLPSPPSALRGRAAMLAVAAGAVVAAGQASVSTHGQSTPSTTDTSEIALAGAAESAGAQTASFMSTDATVTPVVDTTNLTAAPQLLGSVTSGLNHFDELLAKGQRLTDAREAAAAEALRPLFVLPASGSFTSGFGSRWGTLHGGVDIANKIGTPILAVADGTVIDSGPASGFGMWVRLLHDDGTVTVYGHIDTTLVQVGQRVMAGDQIATMGNRGFSTGPHLHFEVHLNGDQKIDPVGWLATRGIALGSLTD